MLDKNYFSHNSFDGTSAGARLQNDGYPWQRFGENIAYGFWDYTNTIVNQWMQSPGHCENIMDPHFKEIGVAHAGKYWTMDLGTR